MRFLNAFLYIEGTVLVLLQSRHIYQWFFIILTNLLLTVIIFREVAITYVLVGTMSTLITLAFMLTVSYNLK